MSAQSYAHCLFGMTFAIGGGGVEIVHTVCKCIIGEFVYRVLVDFIIGFYACLESFCREAHAAVAQNAYTVAGIMIYTPGHLLRRVLGAVRIGLCAYSACSQCASY